MIPAVGLIRGNEPVTASTAILLCVRNEQPMRIIRNLEPMLDGIDASGYTEHFHLYLLSDTSDADFAAVEEAQFSELIARWRDRIAITYRRRTENTGFKAGNIREFCESWGSRHEFAVTLDADSFMPADAVIRLVRIMQVDPRLGILQGLIVGLPSTSLFARIFQFGMRLGMRSYTIGSAWWQSDCGPYWGHNAILRLEPFIRHCQLPMLSGDGEDERHILSHDQIEAALMRAAGYHVRVIPREDLGWEENPPTLLEFMRRDLRWCHGNMQYWRLLLLPNLTPVSRYQLVLAILMFIGSPAWIGLLVLATAALVLTDDPATIMRSDVGSVLLAWVLVMWFSPKIAGALDVLLAPEERRAFGGAGRFTVNFLIETAYSIVLCPIIWIGHTIFLFGLLLNREISWMGQIRDDHAVPVKLALRDLWPQTLVGCVALGLVALSQPWALPYILLLAGGPALGRSVCGGDGLACARQPCGAHRRRPASRGDGNPGGSSRAGFARNSFGEPAAIGELGLAMLGAVRTARATLRSFRIYYGDRRRAAAMDRLYGSFIRSGDLVFDVGAHVGDRVASFRRLGARVVAVEPQPAMVRALRLLYGRSASVAIEALAVGREPGRARMLINADNPTVSTVSPAFVEAARDAPGWETQRWNETIDIEVTTLDALIARHGVPAFIKLDVEGFEAEALHGLSQRVRALSFEFTTIQRDVALACIERCSAMGYTRFNAALGESQALVGEWMGARMSPAG